MPPTSQSLAWIIVRSFSKQESSQHRKATTQLGWTTDMCAGPLITLNCKNRSNSRRAASRRRVDDLLATTFVN